ncbi:MAG: right-handed parallel beta-helix repeat-containing protein, partial [Planctomycetaceae bacterium]|nr:right-handed parallel beta-helix repeat-containing protein [Planctomycetaceae bacterium]
MSTPLVVNNTNDSGPGSLRWAIESANSDPGPNRITFDIPDDGVNRAEDVDSALSRGDISADVFIIRPLTPLPNLTDPTGGTWIDGKSQASNQGNANAYGPEIVIDGVSITDNGVDGIRAWIGADGNRIEGLTIHRFTGNAISIVRSDNNIVAGNYLGTDATGRLAADTSLYGGGLLISAGAEGNQIGNNGDRTNDWVERNVISGNRRHGIRIQQGSLTDVTRGNVIRGNYIGSTANGDSSSDLGAASHGVIFVSAQGYDGVVDNIVSENLILGSSPGTAVSVNIDSDANTIDDNFSSLEALDEYLNGDDPVLINNPWTGIPQLSSLPNGNSLTKTLYLDFDGHFERIWLNGGFNFVDAVTP